MAKDTEGAAVHDKFAPIMDMSGLGGGMSASENRMVNHRGRIIYDKGGPKSTTDGKDTGRNAKNKLGGPAGLLTKEQSPTAWPQSRNRGTSYKGGKGRNTSKGSGY